MQIEMRQSRMPAKVGAGEAQLNLAGLRFSSESRQTNIVTLLSIRPAYLECSRHLLRPAHDPFDPWSLAQVLTQGLGLSSPDRPLQRYSVSWLWQYGIRS